MFTQSQHRSLASSVYSRPRLTRKSLKRVQKLRLCQHTATARHNALRLTRKLRAKYKARKASLYVIPADPPASGGAGGHLQSIRMCESHGNYSTDTGNGFYGAYQFTLSTWASVGGSGNPAQASPGEQDRRAAMLLARDGSAPWPVCG